MSKFKFNSKSEKALYGIYLLNKNGKNPITVEDLAVKLWELYPKEFCMKGYPQFPNVDIQKHLTKLFTANLITGGVVNYIITQKGINIVNEITIDTLEYKKTISKSDISMTRELRNEIDRILASKLYQYFVSEKNHQFIELDFFDFLGTSPRSLHEKRTKSHFNSKINLIKNDLIAYCKEHANKDEALENILNLWNILSNKFGDILD